MITLYSITLFKKLLVNLHILTWNETKIQYVNKYKYIYAHIYIFAHHPHGKEMQKHKMAVWGGLANSCEEKGSEKQRRKGKI